MTLIRTLALSALLGVAAAFGGEKPVQTDLPAPEPDQWSGDWCAPLRNSLGLKSEGREPWLWDLKVFGRLQYQYEVVEGRDMMGNDFDYNTTEVRRFYLGGQARFLRYFQVVGRAVMENDRRPLRQDTEWGYEELWDLAVKTDLKELLGVDHLDALVLGYGKKQINISGEWHTSSKFIKTVERSSIANYVWPRTTGSSNPTGVWLDLEQGPWKGTIGVFTTAHSRELSRWNKGLLYYGEIFRSLDHPSAWVPKEVNLAGFWQDVRAGQEAITGGMDWVSSLSGDWETGPWAIHGNVIVGDNGDQIPVQSGRFWGLVVMPSIPIVPEKLDFVTRYQFAQADEPQGIRLWSRYPRRAEAVDPNVSINGGRGDEHHNIYAGVNYYVCDSHLKLMTGIEYDDLSSRGQSIYQGWTFSIAARTYF
jgi:hypothetical protein